jgi:Protein of unknown function (DUF2877)
MRLLHAISAGQLAPLDGFEGRVHSLFPSAANLRLDDSRLITLLTAGRADSPLGIRLSTPSGFTYEDHLRAGTMVCRGGIIRFSDADFEVDLRHAQHWQSDLKKLRVEMRHPCALAGWRIASDALRHHSGARHGIAGVVFEPGCLEEVASPLIRAARGPVQALMEAAGCLDLPGSASAAARLIGLGPGLTPSGDDFVMGFLSGLWASAPADPAVMAFIDGLARAVSQFAMITTDISAAFLRDAALGQASQPILSLIEAICAGQSADVRRAAQAALAVGSTSGADGVAGLLAGLAVWQTDRAIQCV